MKRLFTTMLLLAMILLSSCSEDEKKKDDSIESKSMAKIYEEQGFPVKISTIENSSIVKWKEYSGTLEGTDQGLVFANLGDNIDKINVSIGDRVEKNQIIAEFSTSNIQARYRQAEIQYQTVERSYNRMKKIYEAGGISLQQLDDVEAQYNVSKINFATTKDLIVIKAPIAGVVVDMFVEEGQKIGTKDPVCKIAKINKLKTTIYIDETDINKLSINDEAIITWEGLKGEEFKGKIDKISISAEPRLRGFAVEISIENRSYLLKPGTFVDVKLKVLELNSIVSIPREVIIKKDDKDFVFIICKDKIKTKMNIKVKTKGEGSIVRLVEIHTGLYNGDMIEVKRGLALNDRLIIEGQTLLEDNASVKIVN